jgi:hypothetical protein
MPACSGTRQTGERPRAKSEGGTVESERDEDMIYLQLLFIAFGLFSGVFGLLLGLQLAKILGNRKDVQ